MSENGSSLDKGQMLTDRMINWLVTAALVAFVLKIVGWFVFSRFIDVAEYIFFVFVLIPASFYICVVRLALAKRTGVVTVSMAYWSQSVKKDEDPMGFSIYLGAYWISIFLCIIIFVGALRGLVSILG